MMEPFQVCSNFAFKFNLCHYNKAAQLTRSAADFRAIVDTL
jgi:hypothetical protein